MSDGITAMISGLKCDNTTCDYRDDSIKVEDYQSYINEPCPQCGTSLLTQADYDQVQNILSLVGVVNSLPEATDDNDEKATVSFEMNGTGNVDIKIEEHKN